MYSTALITMCLISFGDNGWGFKANGNLSDDVTSNLPSVEKEFNKTDSIYISSYDYAFMDEEKKFSGLQTRIDIYLSRFSNPLQTQVLANQFRLCPFSTMCSTDWMMSSRYMDNLCCEQCSCEIDCEEFGTCCPDIIPTSIFNLDQTLHHRYCVPTALKSGAKGVFAYTTCPGNTEKDTQELCTRHVEKATNLQDILPVIDKNNITYKNKYCAKCNFANDTSFWTPTVICKDENVRFDTEEELIKAVLKHPTCNMDFEAPYNAVTGRDRCTVVISMCNVTGLWSEYEAVYEWACGLYYSPVKVESISYQNIFCVLCNGLKEVNTKCFDTSYLEIVTPSFSFVLNVNPYEDSIDTRQCKEGFVKARDACIKASCSPVRVLVGGECKHNHTIIGAYYKISFRLVPMQTLNTEFAFSTVTTLNNLIQYTILTGYSVGIIDFKCILYTNVLYHTNMSIDEVFNASIHYVDIRYKFKVKHYHDPEYMLQVFKNKSREVINVGHNQFSIHIKDDPENKYSRLEHETSLFFMGRSIPDTILNMLLDLNTENTYTRIGYVRRFNVPIVFSITDTFENMLSMMECPFVEISQDRFPWTESTTGLSIDDGKITLKFSEFLYSRNKSNGIFVCLDTYLAIQDVALLKGINWIQKIESIVSVVSVSLSVVCLLFTCITFLSLPSFKTLPWRNNLALTLSLLLAQITYLLSTYISLNKQSISCKVIGVMLHFFLLMFTVWMNICAFHMYRVLTSTKLISHSSGRNRLCLYTLYSVFISVCFIIVNILYSLFGKKTRDFGYGGTVCYINSQLMVILTFGMPLILVLVSNFVLISVVIIKIRKTSKIQKNVKNDANIMAIIAKLSVITGITWIFGILHMFISHPVFSYLFVIVNGSQGIVLMISFVLNKKTILMYKQTLTGTSSKSSMNIPHTEKYTLSLSAP